MDGGYIVFSVSPEDPQELESNIDVRLYSPSVVKCAGGAAEMGEGQVWSNKWLDSTRPKLQAHSRKGQGVNV